MNDCSRPVLESLEFRRHLSATIEDGVLVVTGTRRADRMELYIADDRRPDRLVVRDKGHEYRFDPTRIKRIRVELGTGDDEVIFSIVNPPADSGWTPATRKLPIDIPATVRGGAGNDSMNGSNAGSLLDGGAGNDGLYALNGNDTLLGGDGDDRLDGMAGNDVLRGGAGRDLLMGREGDDVLQGDGGNDTLYGSEGDDRLEGGPGSDELDGGGGRDHVYGNRGTDTFLSFDSRSERKDIDRGEPIFTPEPVDPISVIF